MQSAEPQVVARAYRAGVLGFPWSASPSESAWVSAWSLLMVGIFCLPPLVCLLIMEVLGEPLSGVTS